MPTLHMQWQTTAEKIAKNTIRGLLQLYKKTNGFPQLCFSFQTINQGKYSTYDKR